MPPPGSPQVGNWVSGLESSTPSSPVGGGLGRRGGPRGRLDDSEESLNSASVGGGGCPSNGCGNWLLLVTTTALLALVVLLVASLLQLIMASGHPHNNYINNGGLIPFPQLSVEAILNKILVWIRRNSTVSIPPTKEEVLTNPSLTYPEPPASEATDDPATDEDPTSTEESGETDDPDTVGESYPPTSGPSTKQNETERSTTTTTPSHREAEHTTEATIPTRRPQPTLAPARELWCHVYANAGLRDDQLRTLADQCTYLLVDGEVHLQGSGLMPKVMSDAQMLNRLRGAMPSSVKILLATKDFDSGFDRLLEIDDNEPMASDDEQRVRSTSGTPAISPKRKQAFDAVIGLLKRYQVQGLALRELDSAKHYNQGDKGERAQLRARWAVLYMQMAEYLAEKGFEHAFLVKPSLERYREYSLRNIVNEGLGPVLLTSGALRAATSTLCVSPFKWTRDKRVITQTKVLKEAKDYFGKTWKRNLVFAVAPFVTNCRVYNKTAVYNCTRSYYSEFCKHASRGMLIEGTMRYGSESDCFSAQTRQDDGQVILWTGMGPMSGQFIRSLGQSRGLMMYNAFADDKEGLCGFGAFPLLKAVHDALQGKAGFDNGRGV